MYFLLVHMYLCNTIATAYYITNLYHRIATAYYITSLYPRIAISKSTRFMQLHQGINHIQLSESFLACILTGPRHIIHQFLTTESLVPLISKQQLITTIVVTTVTSKLYPSRFQPMQNTGYARLRLYMKNARTQ